MAGTSRPPSSGTSGNRELPLQRELRQGPDPRVGALDVFRLAREMFLEGRRVDMNLLAETLGVNRATLYRWVGGRQQLLVEVLWSLAEESLRANRRRARAESANWLVEALVGFVDDWLSNPGCQHFMREEADLALRLTTVPEQGFQPRVLEVVREFLAEQHDTGALAADLPLDEFAFVIVRVIESYAHIEYLTGRSSDLDALRLVFGTLLR
ncbi:MULTISPECIES: QsdR family transcriptional regulator [unclassified Amycolatopsis]|uniref:QsdR family transcriptional regulator n=1 Tax=unclassified Amycolatopsis TaxID=2618356 RepID=UPI00106E1444|nr:MULTISPECIES: QsdR family transcriptional regulator [unclassified Amycolatopsis]